MTIQLLIADDHELVREGLRATFRDSDIHVVGEATNCEEAIRLAFSCGADVLLLDIRMPGGDGFAVLQRVRSELSLAVVIYSMHTRDHYLRRAQELGAHAYVPKLAPRDRLVRAIQAASRGETCWNDERHDSLRHSDQQR